MAKPRFDLDRARRDGWTDPEIADFLAGQNNFNALKARQDGYTDQEIIGELNKPEGMELPGTGASPAMAPSSMGPAGTFPSSGYAPPPFSDVPGTAQTGLPGVQGPRIPPGLGGPPVNPRPLPPSQQTFGAPLRYEEPPIRGTHRAAKYYTPPDVRPDWGPQPENRGLLERRRRVGRGLASTAGQYRRRT
jgi:hypothetical protein